VNGKRETRGEEHMVETQEYVYVIQPARARCFGGPTPWRRVVSQHFAYLEALMSVVVILAGRTLNADESSFGIVIFRPSRRGGRADYGRRPRRTAGVMRARLFPYRIALMANLQGALNEDHALTEGTLLTHETWAGLPGKRLSGCSGPAWRLAIFLARFPWVARSRKLLLAAQGAQISYLTSRIA